MDDNAQQVLLTELRRLLVPLAAVTDSGAAGQLFFDITGWESPAGTDLATDPRLAQFKAAYQGLDALIENPPQTLLDVLAALVTLQQLFSSVRQLPFQPGAAETAATELASDLVQALLLDYLRTWHPVVFDALVLLTIARPPAEIALDLITSLLSDPRPVLRAEYLPHGLATAGDAQATTDLLFPRLASLLADLGFHAAYASEPDSGVVPANILTQVAGGMLTVFLQPDFEDPHRYGFALILSPQDLGNLGLVVIPFGAVLPYWDAGLDLTAYAAGFAIGPHGLTVFGTVGTGGGNTGLGGPALPGFVLGSTTGTHLEVAQFQVSGTLALGASDAEFGLIVDMGSSTLVISPGEGDSFLQDVLPSGGVHANVDLAIGWSSKKGFYFRGAADLEATLPMAVTIGDILTVRSVHLLLQASNAAVVAEGSAGFSASLGPLGVTLDRVGLTGTITFPPSGGNLGVADIALGFKPPSGVGLSVDAQGLVTGGGFLTHQGHQYTGALDLVISGVPVKAYGLVQTMLPSGLPGYSFLAVISAEFSPPVQLPFGFSLDGVGGLIGVHRTIAADAVRAAVWAHHLDGLLFPKDPVASAPQLISAIDAYFPAAQGRYVFGPLAKFGWLDDVVTGELALLLELPEPLKLLLIGEIQVAVPSALPQLELHVSFDGGIDFGSKLAWFDASLHDSRISSYPISGDLAFRYGWGDDPVLALALGGFNPHFQPPAAFPALKRLAITIGSSAAQLQAQAYLALTSNTLQFGARVELTTGTGGFNVHGWLGFDALCERDPLSFEFDLSAGVDLRDGTDVLASVHLDGHLTGPAPWHIAVQASLSLLFFDVTVHVDRTWGTPAGQLPLPDPLPVLLAALADPSGWSGTLPPAARTAISAAGAPADAAGAVLLDPAAILRVAQRAVPLDQPVTRFGGAALGRTVQFSIGSFAVSGVPVPSSSPATEEFAPAQFFDLSDADKLSLPSFSRFDAGAEIGRDAVDAGRSARTRAVITPLAYDTTIIDSAAAPRPAAQYIPGIAALLTMNGSVEPARPGLGRYGPAPGTPARVTLAPDRWVVAGTADLGLRGDIGGDGSKLGAHLALARYLEANPGQQGQLQVVLAGETA